jgi:hypothetical protein
MDETSIEEIFKLNSIKSKSSDAIDNIIGGSIILKQ